MYTLYLVRLARYNWPFRNFFNMKIKCRINFFPDESGRIYQNNYRPTIKIRDDEMYNSRILNFIGCEKIQAGNIIVFYHGNG